LTSTDLKKLIDLLDVKRLDQEPMDFNLKMQRYLLSTIAELASFGTES